MVHEKAISKWGKILNQEKKESKLDSLKTLFSNVLKNVTFKNLTS